LMCRMIFGSRTSILPSRLCRWPGSTPLPNATD
jgi:hypothetical protein